MKIRNRVKTNWKYSFSVNAQGEICKESLYLDDVELITRLGTQATTSLVYGNEEESKYQGYIDTVVSEVKKKTGKDPALVSMEIYTTLDVGIQDGINKILAGEGYIATIIPTIAINTDIFIFLLCIIQTTTLSTLFDIHIARHKV